MHQGEKKGSIHDQQTNKVYLIHMQFSLGFDTNEFEDIAFPIKYICKFFYITFPRGGEGRRRTYIDHNKLLLYLLIHIFE